MGGCEDGMPALPSWAATVSSVFRQYIPDDAFTEDDVGCASALFVEQCLAEKPKDDAALRAVVDDALSFLEADDVVCEMVGDALLAKGFPPSYEAERPVLSAGDPCLAELEGVEGEYHEATVSQVHKDGTVTISFDEFAGLSRRLCESNIVLLDGAEADVGESAGRGRCEICDRQMKLTSHHLIPRVTHNKPLNKGKSFEELNRRANLCRACHNVVHASEENLTLASSYNTLELLLTHPRILRWRAFARKSKKITRWDAAAGHNV